MKRIIVLVLSFLMLHFSLKAQRNIPVELENNLSGKKQKLPILWPK